MTPLRPPSPVNVARSKLPTFLQDNLGLPLIYVHGVHETTRLNAETTSRTTSRHVLDSRNVDVLARVELERGLRAENLEVNAIVRVVCRDQLGQRLRSGIQRHRAGGGSRVDHKAVINVGLYGSQRERLVRSNLGENSRSGSRDARVINGKIRGRAELSNGSFYGGLAREIKVSANSLAGSLPPDDSSPCPPWEHDIRVVRHVDDSLLGTAHELRLVLEGQDRGLLAIDLLCTGRIGDLYQHLAREALLAVGTPERELDALAAFKTLEAGDLAHTYGCGALPDLLAPSYDTAVQVVGSIVGRELVRLAVVERVDLGVLDAVGDPSDRLAEVGCVVRNVQLLCGEALHNVCAVDGEGLDDGAEWQERDLVGGGHGGGRMRGSLMEG
jgi:hypothetical protein